MPKKITYDQFLECLSIVNRYKLQQGEHFDSVSRKVDNISKFVDVTEQTYILDVDCSIGLIYAIKLALGKNNLSGFKVRCLGNISISEFLKNRNVGKKKLDELKELCFYAGVELKK